MSKLAKFWPRANPFTLLVAAGLAATAAVLIAFAANRGPNQSRSFRAPRPATEAHAPHGAARGTSDVSPEPAAKTFVSSYVSFLYGQRAADGVTPVVRSLTRQLLDAQSIATPAELSREVVVRDLAVIPRTSTTATAGAVVDDGASPPYALSFNLTLTDRRWLVTAAQRLGR